ncbi:response regulator [Nostoc sp. KVJ3]|uniref:hybrid sensor histidine kinase/response regulator n=1 Tax=Nostoc sp. KVJ3 TaxID=457945 RepID=UPI00223A688D|nr:response regulator [Nostoc sp. KVJ3]MCW5316242.1 response regulator [Nostoc sp. KVJ3]
MIQLSGNSITFDHHVTNLLDNGIVLIVDDVPNNLKVLSDTLAHDGLEVAIATSGESALQQLEYTPVSLILLDVMMPGMDGFETCQRIKANPRNENIPIIFITALSESVNKIKGFELGAVDYITKPFQQSEVLARVRSHLKLNQLSRTLEAKNAELKQLTEQLEERVAQRTQELFTSVEAFKQTQQLLRLVFDTVPQWVAWKNLNSVYLGCNQGFAKVIGLNSPDEIVGKTDYDLSITEEEADLYRSWDKRVIESGQAELHIIEQSQLADGQQVWLDTNKMPLRDVNGNLFGILLVTEDITERQQAQEELKQQKQNLEQALVELQRAQMQLVQSEKMSALGNLVAGVAHEINNPVGFLGGNIQPALDYIKDIFALVDLYQHKYPNPDAEIKDEIAAIDLDYIREDLPKLVNSMREGVKRIRDISTSLRTFSRADSDRPIACNIHDGIDSTILILKHRLKASETRPEIQVLKEYGQLPLIECFAGQLNQVFMNIIANAIDALEESNIGRGFEEIKTNPNCITITTKISDNKQKVIINIKDNALGMTEAVKQKIFDHLFTTKAVGKGTGLGLAIARQIVEEVHSGKLSLNSVIGEGTEFIIEIPG